MWTTVFFGIKSAISGVFSFLVKHPTVLLTLVSLGLGVYFGMHYQLGEDQKVIDKLVDAHNTEVRQRDKKITRLEDKSHELVAEGNKKLDELAGTLTAVQQTYQARLQAEKGKTTVVKVPVVVPGATTTVVKEVTVDSAGDVVCEKMPQSYVDSVNDMIEESNRIVRTWNK